MRAALDFVVRNWPLKLAAILLAVALYAGVVVSQSARTWPGRVPIEALNQPASVFVLDTLPDVTAIRYLAPVDAANRISSASFTASVDLGGVDPRSTDGFVTVPVVVTATDPRVQVVDYAPQRIQVRIDPLVEATVPVEVDRGTLPDGLIATDPGVDPPTVTVAGPKSQVTQVVAALARVRVQPAGLDVDQQVDLVPVDARGDEVAQVEVTPPSARVRIGVSSQSTTRTLPVAPVLRGEPANGYEVTGTSTDPAVVTVHGDAATLAGLSSIPTKPVSVDGAKEDVVRKVALVPPTGVTLDVEAPVAVTASIGQREGTRSFSAGVALDGASADLTYALGSGSVLVTLGGPVAALDAVDAATFTVRVDVADLAPGSHVVPVVVDVPDGLTLVSVTPSRIAVEVIAPAPTPTPSPPPTAEPSLGP
jgi:YbbR domain-containing protein